MKRPNQRIYRISAKKVNFISLPCALNISKYIDGIHLSMLLTTGGHEAKRQKRTKNLAAEVRNLISLANNKATYELGVPTDYTNIHISKGRKMISRYKQN